MGASERRRAILEVLCQRRQDTRENLAHEFGVSLRTISNDIDELSRKYPIITTRGKYGGGIRVQIADGHKMLYEKMEREFGEVHEELDALNSTQAAQEFVLTRRLKQV